MEERKDLSGPRQMLPANLAGNRRPVRHGDPEAPRPLLMDEPGPALLVEYWRVLWQHKGSFLLIVLLGLLLSVSVTLLLPRVYQAQTTLEIQNINENFLNMRDVSPTADQSASVPLETDLQTQIGVLQSESVLEEVIARLDVGKKLAAATQRPPSNEEVLRTVQANLKARIRVNTRIVEVLYDSTDPQFAADVANALTAEFIRQNLQARWQTIQETGKWLAGQMQDVRTKLEDSEAGLQEYARSAGLLFTSEKDNVAEEKLRQLQQELSRAQADRVTRQSRYQLTKTASPDSLPEVLDSPTLKDYHLKLTDLRRQFAELSSTLTPAHPWVKKVQAQVTALEGALEKERANVTRRIQNEYESALSREKLLTASYDAQARVMSVQASKVTHYNMLKREVDNNRQIYDSMLQRVREAGLASALRASNVRVIDRAKPPARPYKPNPIRNAALGVFAGAVIGVFFTLIRERADRSIHSPGEASLCLDVPELGVIPSKAAERSRYFMSYPFGGNGKNGNGAARHSQVELVTSQRERSVIAESFRSTLVSLLYLGENGDRPKVIVVTSPNPREGKTTVASNLALAVSEIGRRVLLIDADLRMPRLHEIFGVDNVYGLSDVLKGTEPPAGHEALIAVAMAPDRELHLLPAGATAETIPGLLHSPRTLQFFNRVRREFDMVIVDTPPMLHIPDARVLGRLADGVLLVVRSAQTTRETAANAAERLSNDGTRVLGTVLNEWDPRKSSHTSYEYGYGPRRQG